MKDFVNDLNINANHIKIVLCNIFNNMNHSKMWFKLNLKKYFVCFIYVYINIYDTNVNQWLKYDNI
jgi:hypothetical protein